MEEHIRAPKSWKIYSRDFRDGAPLVVSQTRHNTIMMFEEKYSRSRDHLKHVYMRDQAHRRRREESAQAQGDRSATRTPRSSVQERRDKYDYEEIMAATTRLGLQENPRVVLRPHHDDHPRDVQRQPHHEESRESRGTRRRRSPSAQRQPRAQLKPPQRDHPRSAMSPRSVSHTPDRDQLSEDEEILT